MSTTNGEPAEPSSKVFQYLWKDFSPMSPYSGAELQYDTNPRREAAQYNRLYAESQTREPLSDNMMYLLRRELADMFYEEAAMELRTTEHFKFKWWDIQYSPITQFEQPHAPEMSSKGTYFHDFAEFLNKQVIVYFQKDDNRVRDLYPDSASPETRIIGRYIFREWYRLYHGRPPFQRHHFFAKAIKVPKEPPQAPKDIPQIVSFHQSLCRRVSDRLNDLIEFQIRPGDPYTWPRPKPGAKTWKQHGFDLGHLFRAVFVVVDSQCAIKVDIFPPLSIRPNEGTRDFRNREREYRIPRYTVLLVKTGDDAYLSSPVDFGPLRESGEALEVNRADVEEYSEDVVRVTLHSAFRFLFDLLGREEEAFAHLRAEKEGFEDERDRGCERWIERVLSHGREVGMDVNGFTWQGIRRAQARMNGEGFDIGAQLDLPWEHLDAWDW
ncbi:hypothetical protein F4860DRAFT_526090 [Xylaria cubensis]|nr:hypothetical protein F4860DRAFT_526090 [Xylaria cubensis]